MIYIAHDNDLITKVAIEPFAGSITIESHPEGVINAPMEYAYNNGQIIARPEVWQYPDRPIRMKMAYADVARLGVYLPELMTLIKSEGIPVNFDDTSGFGYVYFNFVLPEHREILTQQFNGIFEEADNEAITT